MEEDVINDWRNFYTVYSNKAPWGIITPDKHIIDFIEHYQFPAGISILDSGCSHGKNAAYFRRKKYRVHGIDVAESIISFVRRRIPEGNFKVQLAQELEFDGILFDVICDAGCLHVNPPSESGKILKRYYANLKSSGTLFIRIFNLGEPGNQKPADRIFTVSSQGTMPVFGFTCSHAREMLEEAGFVVDKYLFDETYGRYGTHYFYLKKRQTESGI